MKRYLIIMAGLIFVLSSCVSKLDSVNFMDDSIMMTELSVTPEYFFPGTSISMFERTITETSTNTVHDGNETTEYTQNSEIEIGSALIGVRVNNIVCVDIYGNIFLDVPAMLALDAKNNYTISQNEIDFIRDNNQISIKPDTLFNKERTFEIDGNDIYEISKGERRLYVKDENEGFRLFQYSMGIKNEDFIGVSKPGKVETKDMVMAHFEALQKSPDVIEIKSRVGLETMKMIIEWKGEHQITFSCKSGLLSSTEKYILTSNGSEVSFLNKKSEGIRLSVADEQIVITRSVPSLFGSKQEESRLSVSAD